MEAWWATLNEPLRWFYAIAISTSALMILQLLLMMFGIEADDLDDASDAGELHILSVRTVTAFFAGFGWTGVAALQSGASLLRSLAYSAGVGALFMGGVVLLMRALYGMRHSGTLDYHNAIGKIGSVYLPIPPSMAGPGQVEVTVQGRLCVVQAFTRSGSELSNRTRVRVTEVMDQNTLVVEPLDTGAPRVDDTPSADKE